MPDNLLDLDSPVVTSAPLELNKPNITLTEIALLLLDSKHPLQKMNLNFSTPVVHQNDILSNNNEGFLKVGGRREEDMLKFVNECVKGLCEFVTPNFGENLFSRYESEIIDNRDKVMENVIKLYKNESLGMKIVHIIRIRPLIF